jgi:hypothetical protein
MYLVSNMVPPLLVDGEGPPTKKQLDPSAIRTSLFILSEWSSTDRILSPVSLI